MDTGSRQDDVVYEEFKGTGNMELHLSRELSQRRLFPAVDVIKSSTRREEMLLTPEELRAATPLRRRLADARLPQATQQLLNVPGTHAIQRGATPGAGYDQRPLATARGSRS